MLGCMILIATAEPYGGYHLSPFSSWASELVHLTPAPSVHSGPIRTSSDRRLLAEADLLVVTGGRITDWTAEAAGGACSPVVYSELAFVDPSPGPPLLLAGASACSEYSRAAVASHLRISSSRLSVLGSPSLDRLPAWKPRKMEALLLTCVAHERPDAALAARDAGRLLTGDGWSVRVHLHPRDDSGLWSAEFEQAKGSLAEEARTAALCVGVAGTGFLTAIAMGVPTLAVAAVDSPQLDYCPQVRLEEIVGAARAVRPLSRREALRATGPVGGSAARLVRFWRSFC